MAEKLYYIRVLGFNGDSLLWWRPNRRGYTADLNMAGKYTKTEAEEIVSMRPPEDIAYPVDVVDAIAVRHVTTIPNSKYAMKGQSLVHKTT